VLLHANSALNLDIVAVFKDESIGGVRGREKRPGMDALLMHGTLLGECLVEPVAANIANCYLGTDSPFTRLGCTLRMHLAPLAVSWNT
jgi:hypothetical protein